MSSEPGELAVKCGSLFTMYYDDLNDIAFGEDPNDRARADSDRSALIDVLRKLGVSILVPRAHTSAAAMRCLDGRGDLAAEIGQRIDLLHSPYVGLLFHFAVFIAAYRHRAEVFEGDSALLTLADGIRELGATLGVRHHVIDAFLASPESRWGELVQEILNPSEPLAASLSKAIHVRPSFGGVGLDLKSLTKSLLRRFPRRPRGR